MVRRVGEVPPGRSLVEPVERVLVDHENARGSQELGEPVEAAREIVDVMQRSTCDHSVE